MNKKILVSSVVLVYGAVGMSTIAQAALTNGSTLHFNAGVTACASSGVCVVNSGSYFGYDLHGLSTLTSNHKVAISENNGLILGTVQPASGSGAGEVPIPDIENPWTFFDATAMHFTSSATTVLSASGNTATVDFSGLNLIWNGLTINLGGGAWNPISGAASGPYSNGVANVVCAVVCGNGDSYTLDYSSTVPTNDFSSFANMKFFLHLEGTVSAVPVPAAFWLLGSGLIGLIGFARRKKV